MPRVHNTLAGNLYSEAFNREVCSVTHQGGRTVHSVGGQEHPISKRTRRGSSATRHSA